MSNRMDLKGWSERRPRAWRRGRVLPIWQGSNRTRPLHRRHIPKSIQFDMNSSCETIVFPRWDHGLGRGSVRRPRAWRRGRMLPIWQGSSRIRPLHRNLVSKTLYLIPPRQTTMTKYVFEVWSVRRFRAWRRGLMQPIWQVVSSIRPLQFFFS